MHSMNQVLRVRLLLVDEEITEDRTLLLVESEKPDIVVYLLDLVI